MLTAPSSPACSFLLVSRALNHIIADRSLVTNLPTDAMSYVAFPFPAEVPSFSTHGQVLDYLYAYADQHDLHPLIKTCCTVESVRPLPFEAAPPAGIGYSNADSESNGVLPDAAMALDNVGDVDGSDEVEDNEGGPKRTLGKWEVVYRRSGVSGESMGKGKTGGGSIGRLSMDASATGRATQESVVLDACAATSTTANNVAEIFDAVCVCNGHFQDPFTPKVEGFGGFRGPSMHARAYDRPDVEAFEGQRVLCVGSGFSGSDIAREVSSVGEVYYSCRHCMHLSVWNNV